MAPMRNRFWAVALPCIVVAVVGIHQYLPFHRAEITANPVRRDTHNIPIPNTPFNPDSGVPLHWSQQNPEEAPALPIIALSELYIRSIVNGTFPDFPPLVSLNTTFSSNSTPRVQPRSGGHSQKHARFHSDVTPTVFDPLHKRGEAEPCDVGSPCADKACCGVNKKCGFGPDYCGQGNCTSNCDATAMCGRYSEGGNIKCGMNLCCSYYGWCGTSEVHCGNPDPNGLTPCQEGMGNCHTVPPPTCAEGAGSANVRTIGYYQASNTRDRLCNRISPANLDVEGLTHLYFAFAKISPTTYSIVPDNPADVDLYAPFTALQSSDLETWIAIGGFDFSDPGPTRFTWSEIAADAGKRATFINSCIEFMAKYGFQGVDIDWEYPGSSERGGTRADIANFVTLVKDMRAVFGQKYGISLTLAPDYWYLRFFDAKAMEPYVDMFGFMAYDLHGFWDADVKTLGSIVRAQTDIREIYNDTLPLWFDELDPKKINMGLAYYGRGYTLSNPACNQLECPFAGPSAPGPCTRYNGVLSLAEIKQLIRDKGLKPQLIEKSMIKQITWEDQWIGYDDEETIAMKTKWASGYCLGGTMIWSVDFKSGNGVNSDVNGELASVSKDGLCGRDHGNTRCGDRPEGGCCSSSGFCGSGISHCGNGCQSGPCLEGFKTVDGTCGPLHGGSICGSWSKGSCCSSGGYCGSTDEYCGRGCLSGPCNDATKHDGPSGDIYIDPSIWSSDNPTVSCIPPCVYILPPQTLSSATTISFPPYKTSLQVAWKTTAVTTLPGGQVSTVTGYDRTIMSTTLTIPPVTTDQIDYWNVIVTAGVMQSRITLTKSISAPPFTITDNPNPRSEQGVIHPQVVRTITPPPFPYYVPPQATDGPTPTSTDLGNIVNNIPISHTSKAPPGPTCKSGCGAKCKYFCSFPCLLNCPDIVGGFSSPIDPSPGPLPPIGPPPGPGDNDIGGGGGIILPGPPPGPGGGGGIGGGGISPPGPPPGPGGGGGGGGGGTDPDENESSSTSSCTKSSVTNYFVSCTGSESAGCTTTSSAVVAGCDVTAIASTTRDSCPLITLDPNEDQGEDGDGAPEPPTPTNTGDSGSGGLQNTDALNPSPTTEDSGAGALQNTDALNPSPPPPPTNTEEDLGGAGGLQNTAVSNFPSPRPPKGGDSPFGPDDPPDLGPDGKDPGRTPKETGKR